MSLWFRTSIFMGSLICAGGQAWIALRLHRIGRLNAAIVFIFMVWLPAADAQQLPQFHVPGLEPEMGLLHRMHQLHHDTAFTDCTLWDAWLPHATLWASDSAKKRYRDVFLQRRIDGEGYVAMQQHRGMAHSDGWPFPAWQQSTGKGWHFSVADEAFAVGNFAQQALTSADGWEIQGARVVGIDPVAGLQLEAVADEVTITTPEFRCGTIVAPYVRLEYQLENQSESPAPRMFWRFEGQLEWDESKFVKFPEVPSKGKMGYVNVPAYRHPSYAGMLNQYRFRFPVVANSKLAIKSVITAIDTRHPITNSLFVRGSSDLFRWTGDVPFLVQSIGRIRQAINYVIAEFSVTEAGHVVVPWVGHDGRSGLSFSNEGKKSLRPGLGVGNNYWDLLPFGGHDALATIYFYDALERYIELERLIAAHPEWEIAKLDNSFETLTNLHRDVQRDFQRTFWDPAKGRFIGWIDREGNRYDYGFTFVNLEAIAYGLASPEQSEQILEWIDGKRLVDGDTSQGADIYHWRFAARSTTVRNVETYVWAWTSPESIPWGNQVQDGGAVLGFVYFDIMARLRTRGPDDAWNRLRETLAWFAAVENAGGYRKYYSGTDRGTLQGGGTAGGLGLDQEFMESVLVPQVMLYGFLGFQAHGQDFKVTPRLPQSWPSLAIKGIRFRNQVLDITAYQDGRVEVVDCQ